MLMSHLIGIDASRAVKQNRTGTENYSWEIIRAMLQVDQKNRYRLYAPHLPGPDFGSFPNAEWKILPQQRLWSQLKLATEIRKNPPDVLFVPAHVVPLSTSIPSVVTIHGLEYIYSPQSYSTIARQYLNFSTSVSVGKAKKIIAPSQWTKNDVVKHYRCPAEKIIVISEAYDTKNFNQSRKVGERPIAELYIFSIGRLEDRKNQLLLIQAVSLLAKEKQPIKLVLAGKPGYGYEKIQAAVAALSPQVQELIVMPGYVNNDEAARYLKHAAVFAYPSKYEGFGIPMLEAFGAGTPVVASNSSCLPEIAGNAAVLLPPENPLSWAAAISRILHQKPYADELRQKGFAQAAKFSWHKAAVETLKVLEDVAA